MNAAQCSDSENQFTNERHALTIPEIQKHVILQTIISVWSGHEKWRSLAN
jgi:hypothetical protein